MVIIGLGLLLFILLFIYCSIKVAHEADEIAENIENS